jgi:nucleotide-binding universal stress UspA family protein
MKYKEKHIDIMHSIVVPVAGSDDAEKTVAELQYFDPDHVTAVFVAEETEGYPNKSPHSVSEDIAEESREMFIEHFPEVDFRIVQATDIVEGIIDTADEIDASAIVYRPRQRSFISRILSSSQSEKLITHSSYPVVALPEPEEMEE